MEIARDHNFNSSCGIFVILKIVRGRMVSAGTGVGDVARAHSLEEESGPFNRLTKSKHVEHAQEREDLFTRI